MWGEVLRQSRGWNVCNLFSFPTRLSLTSRRAMVVTTSSPAFGPFSFFFTSPRGAPPGGRLQTRGVQGKKKNMTGGEEMSVFEQRLTGFGEGGGRKKVKKNRMRK